MTEALAAFLPALRARFGIATLHADAFDDNPASQAVLRKLGFVRAGTDIGASAARPSPAQVSLYRWHAGDAAG